MGIIQSKFQFDFKSTSIIAENATHMIYIKFQQNYEFLLMISKIFNNMKLSGKIIKRNDIFATVVENCDFVANIGPVLIGTFSSSPQMSGSSRNLYWL